MAELDFSNSVCELLARQLASEKAEAFKHLAIAKDIQKAIIDKKTSIVRDRLKGKTLKLRNRVVTVLRVESHDFEHSFSIGLTLAAEAYAATKGIRLTKKEAECVAKYDECLLKFLDFNYGKEWLNQVLRAASDLSRLKHNIRLVNTIYKVFKFEDAMDPEFFENSGFNAGGVDFDLGRLLEKSIIS